MRTPHSLARCWALLIAAAILYIPANLLPVMHTQSRFGSQDDTIMSGVAYFWTSGSWGLAIIVFIASILVPLLKLTALSLLAFTAQRGSCWRPRERTTLYWIVERIGRWSMLDLFVIMLTVALVRFDPLVVITARPGVIAFGCVVVLTMLASKQFDPRLIWDPFNASQESRAFLASARRKKWTSPTPPSGSPPPEETMSLLERPARKHAEKEEKEW